LRLGPLIVSGRRSRQGKAQVYESVRARLAACFFCACWLWGYLRTDCLIRLLSNLKAISAAWFLYCVRTCWWRTSLRSYCRTTSYRCLSPVFL